MRLSVKRSEASILRMISARGGRGANILQSGSVCGGVRRAKFQNLNDQVAQRECVLFADPRYEAV